jgi:hypothetical protein
MSYVSSTGSFCHTLELLPQGNGLAESNNKNIMNIVKNIVGDNKKSWDSKIKYALGKITQQPRIPRENPF